MRILRTILVTSLAVSFILTLEVLKSSSATLSKADREEVYNRFGEILDAIEYEGLRENDSRTIRENAAELVKRGRAVVKSGPREVPKDFRREAASALKDLDRALRLFDGAARKGSDVQLKQSLTAVRESWDGLTSFGLGCRLPPTVSVNCPADTPAGEQLEVSARATEPEMGGLLYTWTLSEGQISQGQGTPKIVISTLGLGGKTIKLTVTVDDESGFTATTSCSFKVLNP